MFLQSQASLSLAAKAITTALVTVNHPIFIAVWELLTSSAFSPLYLCFE